MAAQGLYWAVLPYCLRRDQNFIPGGLCQRTSLPEEPMLAPLIDRGLFVEVAGGYAYEAADWEAIVFPEKEKEKRREAGRVGGERSVEARRSKYGSAQPRSTFKAPSEGGLEATPKPLEAVPVPVPGPVPREKKAIAFQKSAAFDDEIRRLFDVEHSARQGSGITRLTERRQRAARHRLQQSYPVDQCADAIRGCCADDWCRKTGNDSMAYALQSGENVEKYAALWRQRQPAYRHPQPLADAERGGEFKPLSADDFPRLEVTA